MGYIKLITTSILLALALSHGGYADEPSTFSPLWTLSQGLAQPESVVYDAKHSCLYVSNVQGKEVEKDGNGYISRVSLDGKLLDKEWLKGLDAPKGMTVVGNILYVSDIDTLVVINISKKIVVERYEAKDAKFLNDVTADKDGNIYVSDMLTNTIHCLCNSKFGIWLHDANLMSPNCLIAEKDRLVVGSWGITAKAGHLQAVSYAGKKITSVSDGKPVGNLDGVESDGAGGYYATDWMVGKMFHFDVAGKTHELMQLKQGSADIAYLVDRNLLLIPMMNDSQLKAFKNSRSH